MRWRNITRLGSSSHLPMNLLSLWTSSSQPPALTVASSPRPTFRQFVRFVLSYRDNIIMLNEHWRPQWLHCQVCHVNFDVPGEVILSAKQVFWTQVCSCCSPSFSGKQVFEQSLFLLLSIILCQTGLWTESVLVAFYSFLTNRSLIRVNSCCSFSLLSHNRS